MDKPLVNSSGRVFAVAVPTQLGLYRCRLPPLRLVCAARSSASPRIIDYSVEVERELATLSWQNKMKELELKVAGLEVERARMRQDQETLENERRIMTLEMERIKREEEWLYQERGRMRQEAERMLHEGACLRQEKQRLQLEKERLERDEEGILGMRTAGIRLFDGANNVHIGGKSCFNIYWGSMGASPWISFVDATGEVYHLPEYFSCSYKVFYLIAPTYMSYLFPFRPSLRQSNFSSNETRKSLDYSENLLNNRCTTYALIKGPKPLRSTTRISG